MDNSLSPETLVKLTFDDVIVNTENPLPEAPREDKSTYGRWSEDDVIVHLESPNENNMSQKKEPDEHDGAKAFSPHPDLTPRRAKSFCLTSLEDIFINSFEC